MWTIWDQWSDDPAWDAERYFAPREDVEEEYLMATGMPVQRDEWEEYRWTL